MTLATFFYSKFSRNFFFFFKPYKNYTSLRINHTGRPTNVYRVNSNSSALREKSQIAKKKHLIYSVRRDNSGRATKKISRTNFPGETHEPTT